MSRPTPVRTPRGAGGPARRTRFGLAILVGTLLAACAQAPLPPRRLYQLPLQAPVDASIELRPAVAPPRDWALRLPIRLPGAAQRSQLLWSDGATALEVQEEHRWAEPLRDSIPRVLRHDLAATLPVGSHVSLRPGDPPFAGATQLGVEIDELSLSVSPPEVRLFARWTLRSAPEPGGACRDEGGAQFVVPATDARPENLVLALRRAVSQLAQRIVAQAGPGC